ncbi:MAG: hypothetical protein M0R22_01210 [Dehalococcoidia bacterium]|jgi:hypothetical protein|nr:hypothetical protein [Dehalococcoidia bacterium]
MFYEVNVPDPGKDKIAALIVLNPAESRRLIAKAAVALPEVQAAMKKGWIIIARGITAAYVSEELFHIKVEPKSQQTAGLVVKGATNANTAPPPCTKHVVHDGKVVENADSNKEILNFGPNDVFIKGANAVDPQGNAGIMASSLKGGTWGMFTPVVTGRNSHLIITVGLEKLVPSVAVACEHSGVYYYKWSHGLPAKLTPVVTGKIVTEIQALGVLAGVKAYHICSGGVGGSEGAVTLAIEGDEAHVKKAFDLVNSIKGEPPVTCADTYRVSAPVDFKYDALAQLATLGGT